ncbi:hypothetical protein TNCV_379381 [Trichonephila clavipes]|nr:hypothetical protein TNCV_379381 [Trichonephila clavipes]
MVLKANDRRTSSPCHDEFRGPRSDCVRQHASGTCSPPVGATGWPSSRIVEGLQWMASFKDWRELMCFRFFSPDGTILFIRYCEIFFCAVYLRDGRSDGRPERIIQQTSKFQSQFFGIRFNFPSLDRDIPSARVCQRVPAPGGHWTHKLRGASRDFPRSRKFIKPSGFGMM